jgi:guanine nucleotide-binding protein subunit beta-2-like 1 protein
LSDLCLSQDSRYCLTGSWDGTLRLWDLKKGSTIKRFVSHTRDVLAVAFSPDNRQIASGGRDKNLKIWNTVGECKFTVDNNAHTDWVSCVKFYHDTKNPIICSASWDKTIKVWDNHTMTLKHTFVGHKSQINSLDIAPKANFLASGGKDGLAFIWNLVDGKLLEEFEVNCPINCVLFAPKKYWLIIGTEQGIKVWDLQSKAFIVDIKATPVVPDPSKVTAPIGCTSMAWNKNGTTLYAGFTDNYVRVYKISSSA